MEFKKTGGIIILLMFLVSIVSVTAIPSSLMRGVGNSGRVAADVSADVEVNAEGVDTTVTISGEESESATVETEEENPQGDSPINYNACVEKCMESGNQNRCEARCKALVTRARVQAARRNYADAKEKFVVTKKRFAEQRSTFIDAKKKWKDCEDEQKEECQQAKQDVQRNMKPFLLKSADMVLDALERVRARVAAAVDMDTEKQKELLENLDLRIRAVTEARAAVEAMPDDASREDLREAAKIIKDAWKDTRIVLKDSVGHVMLARLGNILHRVKQLDSRLEATRDKLRAKGKDVTKLDSLLVDFRAMLSDANEAYTEAREAFAAAKTSEDRNAAVKRAHELIVKARTSLKEAQQLLQQALVEIRTQNSGRLEITSPGEAEGEDEEGTTGSVAIESTASAEADATA